MKRVATVLATVAAAVLLTTAFARAENTGRQIFNQKCTMCHIVMGKGGAIGPELTKVASRMSAEDIKAQLENPKKKNPSSTMPAFKTLPKANMDALLGYLNTLK